MSNDKDFRIARYFSSIKENCRVGRVVLTMFIRFSDIMDELTKALNDYYDPRTDHLQKQYLHDQLNRFLTDRNSWCIALSAFQQQQQDRSFVMSPVVVYFLLQVVEHSILHQYADQQQLRQIILWYLVQFFESIPGYLRTKCCYILVKITRCDHQSSIDEFFQTCYHVRSGFSI